MPIREFNSTEDTKGPGFWESESEHSILRFMKRGDEGYVSVTLIIKEAGATTNWILCPEAWADIVEHMK